jgi:hypothetical protein
MFSDSAELFSTPHTYMARPPRCSHTSISYHPLACSLIMGR